MQKNQDNVELDPFNLVHNFKPEINYSEMEDKMDNRIQPLDVQKDDLNQRQIEYVKNNPEYFLNRIKIPEVPGLTKSIRGVPQTAKWHNKITSLQPNGKLVIWTKRFNNFLITGLFFGMVVFGNVQHVMNGRYYDEFDNSQDLNFIIYEKLYSRPISEFRVWSRPA